MLIKRSAIHALIIVVCACNKGNFVFVVTRFTFIDFLMFLIDHLLL